MKKSAKKITGKDFIAKNRIIIGLALIIFSLAFGLIFLPNAVSSAETKFDVYVATQDLPVGTVLEENMFEKQSITDADMASKAYQATDSIIGFENVKEIKKGDVLTKEAYGEKAPTNAESNVKPSIDKVPDSKELIGVEIPSLSAGVSFGLKAGDVIRFYASEVIKGTTQKQVVTPYELQYVEVYGVYDSSGMDCEKSGGAPASLTLIVNKEQAKKIVEIISNSDTYFTLMASGDSQKKNAFLAEQEKRFSSNSSIIPVMPETETTTTNE